MNYISNQNLFRAKVKFYSFCIEPCKITWQDGHTEDSWDGYAKVTLASGEEVIWEYGGDMNPGRLLDNMVTYFKTLEVEIVR